MHKLLQFMGLWVMALLLGGCPLLNQFLDAPESAFDGTPVSGEAPLTVLFADHSDAGSTNITDWQWDFGDGATSLLRNPSHVYAAPGTYTVSLTVTTSVGTHTALRRDYIKVVEKPAAEFTATPVNGGAPLAVSFADTSVPGSNPITAWEWNFGDRTPLNTEQNPVHAYTAPGVYTVSLTVTTAAGNDRETKVQFVVVSGTPVADFTPSRVSGVAPLAVSFTDTSAVGTATVLSWAWDFGDGGLSTEQNPSHTYQTSGVYAVSLKIVTTAGEDQETKNQLITVDQKPGAAFTGTPVSGPAPLSVAFTDESIAGTQPITHHQWDFGDGGLLSTLTNPVRVYSVPGKYSVSLQVTTAAGADTLLKPDYITVTPGVDFNATPTAGKGSMDVQFSDTSALGGFAAKSRAWDFGDGGTSTEANPAHTYAAPGVYDVSLTLTTELGASVASRAGLITVNPDTDFSATPTSGASPLAVVFKDLTVPGAVALTGWSWNFGDGATSAIQNPGHTYSAPGLYTVSLQTTTATGSDTEQKSGLIGVKPVVDFAADARTGQGTLSVKFSDLSNAGNLNILGWYWDFGDGASSTQRNPSHTYAAIGSYDVSLKVTTALGDELASKAGYIQVGPAVDFSADKVAGAGTLSVSFTDKSDPGSLEIAGWLWNFGDGGSSTEQNAKHDFGPGLFNVGLTVTTSLGDASTVKEALILVNPAVTLGAVQPMGPAPFEASLLDLTQVGAFEVSGWLWDFGDGTTSEEQNPVHTFEEPGKYTVTLTLATNGGEFSSTRTDFITAQRGPTAAFTQTVVRGAQPADPVTVSFVNRSLPGDSPILNQTWDFGASAVASDETATEANPTVTYPGVAFDTLSQDVSLTVRTFIAENTLLKENLFSAPVTKSTLPVAVLDDAAFSAIDTDGSGAVWAIGTGDSPIVVCFSPTGTQRWGVALDHKDGLELRAVHAPGDGTVYVAGTLGDNAWLARLDAEGNVIWEYRNTDSDSSSGVGLASRADGTVLLGVCREIKPESFGLQVMRFGEDGHLLETSPALLPVDSDSAVSLAEEDGVLWAIVASDDGATVSRLSASGDSEIEAWSALATVRGLPVAISPLASAAYVLCAVSVGDEARLFRIDEASAVDLPLHAPGALLTLQSSADGVAAVWLGRDGEKGGWKIGRERIAE